MSRDYDEVGNLFRDAMVRELHANTYKGNWLDPDLERLMHEIRYHTDKFARVVESLVNQRLPEVEGDPSEWLLNRVLEFGADIGNCTMFVLDKLDVLDSARVAARAAENDYMENNYEEEAGDGTD